MTEQTISVLGFSGTEAMQREIEANGYKLSSWKHRSFETDELEDIYEILSPTGESFDSTMEAWVAFKDPELWMEIKKYKYSKHKLTPDEARNEIARLEGYINSASADIERSRQQHSEKGVSFHEGRRDELVSRKSDLEELLPTLLTQEQKEEIHAQLSARVEELKGRNQ